VFAGAIVGPVVWTVLAALTCIAALSPRVPPRQRDEASGEVVVLVTRFARPAKAVAVAIASVVTALVIGAGVAAVAGTHLRWSGFPWIAVGLFAILFALLVVLAILLLAVIGDVRTGRGEPGRGTRFAYGVVGILHAAMVVFYLVNSATGARML